MMSPKECKSPTKALSFHADHRKIIVAQPACRLQRQYQPYDLRIEGLEQP